MPTPHITFDKTPLDRPQDMVVERVASEMIDRQHAWKEGEIAKLLPRWLRWLLVRTRSRFIARLTGIEWHDKRDDKTGATTIELWQRGVLKARSTWRYTYDQPDRTPRP